MRFYFGDTGDRRERGKDLKNMEAHADLFRWSLAGCLAIDSRSDDVLTETFLKGLTPSSAETQLKERQTYASTCGQAAQVPHDNGCRPRPQWSPCSMATQVENGVEQLLMHVRKLVAARCK